MNLSSKNKIFCALDFTELKQTCEFVERIKENVGGIKVGLEFFFKNGIKGVESLKKYNLPIFLDLKLNDIPNTVSRAARNLLELEPEYLTAHLNGGIDMIRSLVDIKLKTKIIGVSLLTSLNDNDLKKFGLKISSKSYVEKLSKIGYEGGVDGMVSSSIEVKDLKNKMPKDFIFVTPGIQLSDTNNDQKRTSSPLEAIKNGSSILIIGRAITNSSNPNQTLKKIISQLEENGN